jgi:hypothetical protein
LLLALETHGTIESHSGVSTKTKKSGSTDPRDKLYALLHMVIDTSYSRFTADYARDTGDLFTAVASYLFKNIGLRLLNAVNGKRMELGYLPSWAPDWSKTSALNLVHKEDGSLVDPPTPAGGPPDWTVAEIITAKVTNARASHDLFRRVLKVRGVRIGQIAVMGETCDSKQSDWKGVVSQWRTIAQAHRIYEYPVGRPVDLSLSFPDKQMHISTRRN